MASNWSPLTCAACGERIEGEPVWVQLADKGNRHPDEAPFALHPEHYPKGGKVEVQEPAWFDDNGVLQEGETYMAQRYEKVNPNG